MRLNLPYFIAEESEFIEVLTIPVDELMEKLNGEGKCFLRNFKQ